MSTIGFQFAFTQQIERTALGKMDARAGTCLSGSITTLGCERDTLGDINIYRSAGTNGQTTAGSAVFKHDIIIDIVTSRLKCIAGTLAFLQKGPAISLKL